MRRQIGDVEFEAYFLTHYDAVVRSLTYVCGSRDRAADATQEAFIRAYARWPRIRTYDNPVAWIHRAAVNVARDAHRSETRRLRREERVAPVEQVERAVEVGDSPLDLLAGLPEQQRTVAALYYLDDLPVSEISAMLDLAEGTVRYHLSEARRRLRSQIPDRSVIDASL